MKAIWNQHKKYLNTSAAHWILGYLAVLMSGVWIVYYWRVSYDFGMLTAGTATIVVCAGFSAIYGLVFLCAHFIKQNLALKTAALVLLAGLCFGAANPPLQTPDETMHFLRAYSIGSGNFLFNQQENYPDDVDLLEHYFSGAAIFESADETAGTFSAYFEALTQNKTATNSQTHIQQIVAYLPQAIGVAIGRLFGANAMVCMYLARFINLLFYAAVCGLTIHFASRFKAVLIAMMLCPVCLFMAASCSSDSMFMALCWLFIGICLSDTMTRNRLILLGVSFGIVFYIKFTAIALLPLVFMLPIGKKQLGKRKLTAFTSNLLVLAFCIVTAGVLYFLQNSYVVIASDYVGLTYSDPNIRPMDQLAFIFRNPARYLAVFCYTLYRDKANIFSMGAFGWMNMVLPFVSYFSPLVLVFSAAISAKEGAREPLKNGILLATSAALLYAFTYTGMYLTSTPVTLPEINGVQTRYLVAAFFALLVLLSMLIGRTMQLQQLTPGKPQKTPPEWRMLHYGFCYAVVCALLLFQGYYIGI